MKKWLLPNLAIDLSNLWTHPEGPRITGGETRLSEDAWKAFRLRAIANKIGFFELPEKMKSDQMPKQATDQAGTSWEKTAQILRADYEGAVLIGIGGSYLGAEALLRGLRLFDDQEKFPFYWVTQPDPESIRKIQGLASRKKLATIVISKSGNTIETLSAFYNLSSGLDPKGYVIITDPESGELRALARREAWTSIAVPADIGGRFSVISAVGLFPALLGGIDINKVVEGARSMKEALINFTPDECPAFWLALSHFRWDVECARPLHYLMPYRENLSPLAEWHAQLFGESLGKLNGKGERVGFTPVAALGSTDQHSLLQLFKEGPRNKVVGFIDVVSQQSTPVGDPKFSPGPSSYLTRTTFEKIAHMACHSTVQTLHNSQVPTYRVVVDHLTPATMGSLFFLFQTACALAGELYGVDAFGQPGVEEGKRLLKEALLRP